MTADALTIELRRALARLARTPRLLVACDYDGTLAPLSRIRSRLLVTDYLVHLDEVNRTDLIRAVTGRSRAVVEFAPRPEFGRSGSGWGGCRAGCECWAPAVARIRREIVQWRSSRPCARCRMEGSQGPDGHDVRRMG